MPASPGEFSGLDALQVSSSNPDPDYVVHISLALSESGLNGFESALRNPTLLAESGDFYHHRAQTDALIITGDNGSVMSMNEGDRIVIGGAGNDIFRPGEGKNLIDLGGGQNEITYDLIYGIGPQQVGITIDMESGTAVKHSGDVDHFTNVQKIVGSRGDDTIEGSSGDDLIVGISTGLGIEEVRAGAGNDTVYGYDIINPWLGQGRLHAWGEEGEDVLIGTNGSNFMDGGTGNDTLYGLGGNDTLIGGTGDDLIDGGDGIDTADFSSLAVGISVTLSPSFVLVDDVLGSDTLVGIENFWSGSGSDTLIGTAATTELRGNDGDDLLIGGAGNSLLVGGAGDDTLSGEGGHDTLVGGLGNDLFIIGAPGSEGTSVVISDFASGVDRIEISGDGIHRLAAGSLGAAVSGNQEARFIRTVSGNQATADGWQFVQDGATGALWFDHDGLGAAAAIQVAQLGSEAVVAAADITIVSVNPAGSGPSPVQAAVVAAGLDAAGLATLRARVDFWIATLPVLDALQMTSSVPDEFYGIHVEEALVLSGLAGLAGGLRTPHLLAMGHYAIPSANQVIIGDASWQNLKLGNGSYFVDLGGGDNTVSYETATEGLVVDLAAGTALRASGKVDHLLNVRHITGSIGNDTIIGDAQNNTLNGGGGVNELHGGAGNDLISVGGPWQGTAASSAFGDDGNDTINGNSGNNLLEGGAGDDHIWADHGQDTLRGGDGNDLLLGGDGNDFLEGGDGNDVLWGDSTDGRHGNDFLDGGAGNDTLNGGSGSDTLVGGSGNNLLNGGSDYWWIGGRDVADYSSAAAGIVADLRQTATAVNGTVGALVGDNGYGGFDILVGMEVLIGSAFDDLITLGAATLAVSGGAGNDQIIGSNLADVLDGGAGNDTLDCQRRRKNASARRSKTTSQVMAVRRPVRGA